MCGISGFIAKQGNLLPDNIILNMTDLIHHRGPDDEGFMFLKQDQKIITAGGESTPFDVWKTHTESGPIINVRNNSNLFSLLSFGHKRLSILDLTPAGHQPMSYKNGSYWIVFNGEIYNYKNIKNELEKLGHHFTTKTDTETILAAYSEWGEACLDKFVGMWAFAIYDRTRNEIFIARDRYGIKPFYYYFSSFGDFYFSSEIKQFTALNCWQSKFNPERVYDQLIYSFTDHTDETMFERVFQLPGGTFFKSPIDCINHTPSGKLSYKKWYLLKRSPFKGSFIEAASIFRTLFEVSVKEHLNADVPVGSALSGGLDSSSIVCEVNRILKASGTNILQKTFSSCSEYERYSEKKWMDIVINYTNVDAYFVFPQLKNVFEITPDVLWQHDEPYQSQSAFLAYNVFKMAHSHNVKVLLNGQGADEYLGGYGQFTIARYVNLIKHLRISTMLADIKNMQEINPISSSTLYKGFAAHLLPTIVKRGLTKIHSSSDRVKNIIDTKKLGANLVHPFNNIPLSYNSVPQISEHLTFYSTLPKYLHWEDRNSMAHSVEARVPFLDHRLVEFTYNLPDDFLEKDGITKRVMREAMTGLLPEKIKNRRDKMGYTTPEEHWVRNENPDVFRSKILEAINITNGIIKPEALKYFDSVLSGKLPFDYTYWRIILLGEWIKRFQIRIN
jgi:asparagine synthase (glutamine-hydrolysing)